MKDVYDNKCIFGIRPIIEGINQGMVIDKILIQKGLKGQLFSELKDLICAHKITTQYVPIQKLNRLTKKNHQGVYAFISPIPFYLIEEIIIKLYEGGKSPFILMLDRISDIRNFGAIVRTAECMGIHAIIIGEKGAAQINSAAIKTSAGALLKLPICKEKSLLKSAQQLKHNGLEVIACSEKSDNEIQQTTFTKPIVVIMGSEKDGINNDLLKICDKHVKITQYGKIESLNVSVAAGIILYEIAKQRVC